MQDEYNQAVNQKEIQLKITELQSIMSQFKHQLGALEKELYRAISDYQKALEEEKLKKIRQNLA